MEARGAALEPRLPRLILSLEPGSPSTTTATDDAGATVGSSATWGIALPFDPGRHRFQIAAPGYTTASLSVDLTEGQTVTVPVRPGRALGESPERPGSTPAANRGPGIGPWIVGGIGVVGLVVGAAVGAVVIKDHNEMDAGCSILTRWCTTAGHNAAVQGASLGPASTVGLVVGAAGLVGGGLWWGLTRPGDKKGSVGIAVGPMVGGARVGGSW
jgi:hypothetical protein